MIKQWFSNKKKQLKLVFSKLVLKGYSKFIPFLRRLKIYSLDDIKEKTRGPKSEGVPYADGLIMGIQESGWKDGKVSVLFCYPNGGFIAKTVEAEMLVAGLVDFGSPRGKWPTMHERAWGGIEAIGTLRFSKENIEPMRFNQEDINRMKEEIQEEYRNKTKE